jgi:hypothetical protein
MLPILLGTKLTVPSAVIYRSDRNYKTNRGAYLKAGAGAYRAALTIVGYEYNVY